MREHQKNYVLKCKIEASLYTLYSGFKKIPFTLYTYVLAKILQDGAKFIEKLTPAFRNKMRNLNSFRQAVESSTNWNLMGFCPKNTFLQLKHYMQRIYLTLLSTTSKNSPNYLCHFCQTISHFSQQTPLYLLAQRLHSFHKSSPSKCKFLDFPQLRLKFTKFLTSFFKLQVSFSSKLGSFFSVMKDNSSVLF